MKITASNLGELTLICHLVENESSLRMWDWNEGKKMKSHCRFEWNFSSQWGCKDAENQKQP